MLSDQIMTPSLRRKWSSLRDDAKAALETAFRDGIRNPVIVPNHYCYLRRCRALTIEFHHFRIGYAHFVIALIENFPPILWDADLADGLPLYPP